MCKSLTYLVALVLLLGVVGIASAAVNSVPGSAITSRTWGVNWTGRVTQRITDQSGLSPGGTYGIHGYRFDDGWMSGNQVDATDRGGTPSGAWVEFEFNRNYNLGETWVWNVVSIATRGMRNVQVHYSTTGSTTNPADWTKLGDFELDRCCPGPEPAPYQDRGPAEAQLLGDFGGASAKYVVITADDVDGNWGGCCVGLNEIIFIPEPASLVLLGLGGVALLRRRTRKRS